jgi:hypothetical protein
MYFVTQKVNNRQKKFCDYCHIKPNKRTRIFVSCGGMFCQTYVFCKRKCFNKWVSDKLIRKKVSAFIG